MMVKSAFRRCWFAVFCAIVAAAPWLSSTADAAGSGSLEIVVSDARNDKPLSLVRVFIVGPQTVVGYSDQAGAAVFEDLAEGRYEARIVRRGYRSAFIDLIEVKADLVQRYTVKLSSSQLAVIGVVKALRQKSAGTVAGVNVDDPATRLSGSLFENLDTLGVTIGSEGGVSLGGQSPGRTGFQIDGVSVPGLGNVGLRGLDGDLFRSVYVSQDRSANGPAGSLDLHTQDPSIAWQGRLDANYDTRNGSGITTAASGTVGLLGVSAVHAERGLLGVLDGQTYADFSGRAYAHSFGSSTSGNALKLRLPFGENQSLSTTLLSTMSSSDQQCASFTTILPCGYGPGSFASTVSKVAVGTYRLATGIVTVTVNGAAHSSTVVSDQSDRLFLGLQAPSTTSFRLRSSAVSASVSDPLSDTHVLSLNASVNAIDVRQAITDVATTTLTTSQRYGEVGLLDQVGIGRVDASFGAGLQWAAATKPQLYASLTSARRIDTRQTVTASARVDGSTYSAISLPVRTDAASAEYFCRARGVVTSSGTSPADASGRSSALVASYDYRSAALTIRAALSSTWQRNASLLTYVPASNAQFGELSDSVVSELQADFA